MKNTKENTIKILEGMRSNAHAVANHFKAIGDEANYNAYIREASTITMSIALLTDKSFFDSMAELFLKESN